ncbi:MAG TPA: hypothetical protein VHZ07_15695 [Bryobacteraceae bacterium]|jgi:hypothetical protein|nr:hypothetical protein [Bryobacteraceae bacterium]
MTVLAIEQLAMVITLMFGGGVLLLLLGTQILNWYWLALLGIAAIAMGAVRMILKRPARYQVAQRLDGRLGLHDSIATAWHLLTNEAGHENPAARFQIDYAGKLAETVNAKRAFPFTGQRTWGLAGALAGLAFGLFAVRYLVQNSLNLEHPLITVHLEPVFENLERRLSAANHNPNAPGFASTEQTDPRKDATGQDDGKTQKSLDGSHDPNGDRPAEAASANSAASNKQGPSDGKKQDGKSDGSAGGQQENKPGAGETASSQSNERTTNSPTTPNTREIAGNQQNQQPGLLDKMKDAMSTLLSKMRPNGNSQNQQRNSQNKSSQDRQTSQMSQAERDQHGQSQKSQDQQNSQDPNSQGEEQGQTAEKAQAAQGHSSDRPSDKNGSDAHSGIGRQDGAKDLKEAQQEEAMGKLAEIFGKRSAVVSGDVMVETPSGKQQLKTDYSQRMGSHSDLGGEINRDEVPLIYQQYVREYMEQVRKQAKSENVNQ